MELFLFFFFLCVNVTKTCVLLVAVQHSDVRPTLCDVFLICKLILLYSSHHFLFTWDAVMLEKKKKRKKKQQQQQKGLHFVCDDLLYAVSHVDAHMHAHDLPIIKAAPFILSICIILWNLHMHLPLSII